jgi:hypothetical protein
LRSGIARFGALEKLGFVLLTVGLTQPDAVDFDGASDEEAVSDVPRVFSLFAPDWLPGGPPHLDLFALVENILLQFLPIVVAPGQHLTHERIEIGFGVY